MLPISAFFSCASHWRGVELDIFQFSSVSTLRSAFGVLPACNPRTKSTRENQPTLYLKVHSSKYLLLTLLSFDILYPIILARSVLFYSDRATRMIRGVSADVTSSWQERVGIKMCKRLWCGPPPRMRGRFPWAMRYAMLRIPRKTVWPGGHAAVLVVVAKCVCGTPQRTFSGVDLRRRLPLQAHCI